ncbi:MAG TPA: DUF4388 domain-containing protein [Candidatus Polarisedimenticolaceae bacterium]
MHGSTSQESVRVTTGRLEGISVPDLFWSLCRSRSTGVLHLTSKGNTKRVYFQEGRIIFAASTDPNDRLGEMLLREGVIRLDHLERAIARLPEGKRLGTILVEAGHLSPDHLVKGVLRQVRAIVLSLFPWEEGEHTFVEGPLPTDEVVTLGMNTGDLLIQGIRSVRSFSRIRRSVGSPRTRYRATESWRDAADGLQLSEGERQLLTRLDGAPEPVSKLCEEVYLSNFEIYQALWAFKVLGLIQEAEAVPDAPSTFGVEGRLDADGLAGLFVRLGRAAETGVLFVTRGSVERTFHLREGRCVFATSNSIDDGLIAYLLRRGVISLRDREETARRLLSNKRVGTILQEMGVIQADELDRLVREHLLEIVWDTFRWPEGEWLFASGELPSFESITMDRSLEDLILQGLRGVSSWPRIKEGCGGLGSRLELTPGYLGVLDRMTVSAEDWELVTSLRSPRSPLELCREHPLGDYRVCQTLWALRLLGAVAEAPLDEAIDMAFGGAPAAPAESSEPPAPVEPAPIAPAQVADEAFEVTRIDEITPSVTAGDGAIAPSEWSEPTEERTDGPHAWKPSEDVGAVEISGDADGAEIVNEAWRLATPEAESWGRPEPEPETPPEPAAGDGPHFEMATPGTGVASPYPEAEDLSPARDFELDLPATRLEAFEAEPEAVAEPVPAPEPEPEPLPEPEAESEVSGAPLASLGALDSPDTDRTMIIPREQVEALFATDMPIVEPPVAAAPVPAPVDESHPEPEPEPGAEAELPAWEPPVGIDDEIARFNARHKIVFGEIRKEIGAGAVNFVKSCRASLGTRAGQLFVAAELQGDGSYEPGSLRRSVIDVRMEDAPDAFRGLIDQELTRLAIAIGEKRLAALRERLEKA